MTRRRRTRRRPHRPECRHCPRVRLLGVEFRAWRESWALELDATACGYAPETVEFTAANPAPTFRTYLESMAGAGWPMSGTAPRRHLSVVPR